MDTDKNSSIYFQCAVILMAALPMQLNSSDNSYDTSNDNNNNHSSLEDIRNQINQRAAALAAPAPRVLPSAPMMAAPRGVQGGFPFVGAGTSRQQQPQRQTSAGGGGGGGILGMINLAKIPFFGKSETLLGKAFWDWIKRPKASFNDSIDRLNCQMIPMLLLFFVGVISANILGFAGGEAMRCLRSPELNAEELDYALDYCTSKNQYYVAPEEGIPWTDVERNKRQLGYYHWVPITLMLQALLFFLPNWLWTALNRKSGIDYVVLIDEARHLQYLSLTDERRPQLLDELAAGINEGVVERCPKRLRGFRFGRSLGSYVCSLYLAIKFLYLVNVAMQFFFLNAFIGRAYQFWGYDVLKALIAGDNWQDSPVFPRLTLCDIPIRRLGDVPRYTIQCHLRINTYNEKIYLFIWWLFLATSVLTLFNFLYYFVVLQCPWICERSVRYLLRQDQFRELVQSTDRPTQRMISRFADQALRHDGMLLFWFIEGHAGPIVARQLMARIFADYVNTHGFNENPNQVVWSKNPEEGEIIHSEYSSSQEDEDENKNTRHEKSRLPLPTFPFVDGEGRQQQQQELLTEEEQQHQQNMLNSQREGGLGARRRSSTLKRRRSSGPLAAIRELFSIPTGPAQPSIRHRGRGR